ncbi:MAG: alpha/beta hydrolase, partial [Patescibacteria group bacterium]
SDYEPPTGYSNVAFLPGLQASRLYRQGVLLEDQLWEPNRDKDVEQLYLDPRTGDSNDQGIYTRDIIDEAYTELQGFNVYKKFIDFMNDELVGKGIIREWKALPYDWRLDFEDIIEKGVVDGQDISYLSATDTPYIISELNRLADTSPNGKVTLITHSNGGLVAKYLLKKLQDENNPLLQKIDKLIMVAAPQLGTPKAIEGLLHSDKSQFGAKEWGIFLDEERARELAENMQSAYNLLPSEEYFKRVESPVIEFKENVNHAYDFRALYGKEINSADELYKFLLGDNGARTEPDSNDEESPNVLKSNFLSKAINTHNTILDNWIPPSSIEVIQIAGWGLDTIGGIRYGCNFLICSSLSTLNRKLLFTTEGDGTV